MRRTSVLMLLTGFSVGILASCAEDKPSTSAGGSKGTVKLIPANMAGDGAGASSSGSTAMAGGAPGTVTRVFNPTEDYNRTHGGAGAAAAQPAPQPAVSTPVVNHADLPDVPVGAQWTLYCQTVQGVGHIERSNDLKRQLVESTGLKGWYVIHAADASNIYYGFYQSIDRSDRSDNRKDGQQAQMDRKRIDGMKDGQGERPFARCMFVELTAPDPEAPADWDLRNTPSNMFWSVQIAAYQQHPDRKKFAVDAVREARARGIKDAYFYHGPSVSSVCIGAWPLEAVRYDLSRGQAGDPTRTIFVMPEGLPPIQGNLKDDQGRPMTVATKEVEIVDPSLIATLQKYPTHAINGAERIIKGKDRNGKETERAEPSFMVRIPNRFVQGERTGDAVNPDQPVNNDPGFSFLRPQNQPREKSKYDYIPTGKSGSGK